VNAPAAESDLRTTGEEAFLAALGAEDGDPAAAGEQGEDADDEKSRSRLWAVVLGIVAAGLLLESMLANRVLLGARRSVETGAVTADGSEG